MATPGTGSGDRSRPVFRPDREVAPTVELACGGGDADHLLGPRGFRHRPQREVRIT